MYNSKISKAQIDMIILSLDLFEDKELITIEKKESYKSRLNNIKIGHSAIFTKEELLHIKRYAISIYSGLLNAKKSIFKGFSITQWKVVNEKLERWIYETKDIEFEFKLP